MDVPPFLRGPSQTLPLLQGSSSPMSCPLPILFCSPKLVVLTCVYGGEVV